MSDPEMSNQNFESTEARYDQAIRIVLYFIISLLAVNGKHDHLFLQLSKKHRQS